MFDLLNLIFMATTAVTPALVAYADLDVQHPQLGHVAYVSFHTGQGWWADKNCKYTGLMVPYAREWPLEKVEGLGAVAEPPEPGKLYGYAFILNKKECKGKDPEPMTQVAERLDGTIIWNRNQMNEGYRIDARDIRSMADKPLWLLQVSKIIEAEAATDPAAKAFLEFSAQAATVAVKSAVAPTEQAVKLH